MLMDMFSVNSYAHAILCHRNREEQGWPQRLDL